MEEKRGEVSSSRSFHGGGVEYVDECEEVGPLATCKVGIGCEGVSGAHGEGVGLSGVVLGSPPRGM